MNEDFFRLIYFLLCFRSQFFTVSAVVYATSIHLIRYCYISESLSKLSDDKIFPHI